MVNKDVYKNQEECLRIKDTIAWMEMNLERLILRATDSRRKTVQNQNQNVNV